MEKKDADLEHWMTEYGTSILRVSFLYTRDRQLAEDIAQETFLKAYLQYEQFRRDAALKTWLMRIAINLCKDHKKSTWFRRVDCQELIEELFNDESGLEEIVSKKEENLELIAAIMNLPAIYKEVILLHYYQEFSVKEAAQILAVPEATVFTRLRRARTLLKKRLKGWYYDEETN